MQSTIKVSALDSGMPEMVEIASDNSGVASENVVAEQRTACFGKFLLFPLPYMEHIAECNGAYDMEAPRGNAPVEQRIRRRPILFFGWRKQMFPEWRGRVVISPFNKRPV